MLTLRENILSKPECTDENINAMPLLKIHGKCEGSIWPNFQQRQVNDVNIFRHHGKRDDKQSVGGSTMMERGAHSKIIIWVMTEHHAECGFSLDSQIYITSRNRMIKCFPRSIVNNIECNDNFFSFSLPMVLMAVSGLKRKRGNVIPKARHLLIFS